MVPSVVAAADAAGTASWCSDAAMAAANTLSSSMSSSATGAVVAAAGAVDADAGAATWGGDGAAAGAAGRGGDATSTAALEGAATPLDDVAAALAAVCPFHAKQVTTVTNHTLQQHLCAYCACP